MSDKTLIFVWENDGVTETFKHGENELEYWLQRRIEKGRGAPDNVYLGEEIDIEPMKKAIQKEWLEQESRAEQRAEKAMYEKLKAKYETKP